MSEFGSTQSSAAFLQDVFPGPRFSESYLQWQYEKNPEGNRIGGDHQEAQSVLGHYAMLPQTWRRGEQVHRLAFAVNGGVSRTARRKGLFVGLVNRVHDVARDAGVEAVIGVANASSILPLVRRTEYTHLASLPVVAGMTLPRRRRSVRSFAVDQKFLDGSDFARVVVSIEDSAERGFAQAWTPEKLRWRLSSPLTCYVVHVSESGFLVSCKARYRGVSVVVALKFLRYRGANIIDAHELLSAASYHHGTPWFVYAGYNDHTRSLGIPLPRRFLPSPLNLIYVPLSKSMPAAADMRFSILEFLDFDPY